MNPAFDRIITSSADDRRDLFVATARRTGMAEQSVEKDFWVCWTLDALFHALPARGPRLLLKGGTSLSKGFGLISRFSEDIDVTVFRADLGESISIDDLEKLSGKKRENILDRIKTACQQYLGDHLRPQLTSILAEAVVPTERAQADVVSDNADPDQQTLLLRYPSVLSVDPYVRPTVRIECGAKSALDPHRPVTLEPYVADDMPDADLSVGDVTTIVPERTFWDKVVILHGLRRWFERRGELRQEGQRISRHYYDLHSMHSTSVGEQAIGDTALGKECARHARMFFNRPDFDLATAVPGSFMLTPTERMIEGLRRDYTAMVGMIFRSVPRFEDVLASIATIEERLNARSDARESNQRDIPAHGH
ncbi:MAG TPA: nucleotidyl transferase AbiEii/AbiGii toxin family protein [bacterium]|nr:nucleotidyl transferase AbiEii/AbiGii toxin family protein [bacterium]